MNERNNKGCGCGCGCGVIIVIFLIIFAIVATIVHTTTLNNTNSFEKTTQEVVSFENVNPKHIEMINMYMDSIINDRVDTFEAIIGDEMKTYNPDGTESSAQDAFSAFKEEFVSYFGNSVTEVNFFNYESVEFNYGEEYGVCVTCAGTVKRAGGEDNISMTFVFEGDEESGWKIQSARIT